MNEMITRLTIEHAKNGYMVYINDNYRPGESRSIPYVFMNIGDLNDFIETKFRNNATN